MVSILGLALRILALSRMPLGDPSVVPNGLGVCAHPPDLTVGQAAEIKTVGFSAVRTDLPWPRIERVKGSYDFSRFDPAVQSIAEAGLRPLLIMGDGNRLYGEPLPKSDESIQGFVKFALACMDHYRGYHPIWEIWNEPDNRFFWPPTPNPDEYVRMALPTAKALRAADPEACIVSPSVGPNSYAFFEAVCRSGMLDYIDDVSVHPYRQTRPESVLDDYNKLLRLIASFHPTRRVGVLCTEWGYPLSYMGLNDDRQASYLLRAYLLGLAAHIDGTFLYEWQDHAPGPGDNYLGFKAMDHSPKSDCIVLQEFISNLRGYRFTKLQTEGDEYFMTFRKGMSYKVVAWTAAGDPDGLGERKDPKYAQRSFAQDVTSNGHSYHLTSTPTVVSEQ